MAFGADEEVWDVLSEVAQQSLATIAQTIARFESVKMLVRRDERRLAARLCGEKVTLIDADLKDLCIRDTGPTFAIDSKGKLGAVDLNFNGWGEKQKYDSDAAGAELVAEQAQAAYLTTELIGEGDGIEVNGEGTAIVTESCFVNDNRNSDLGKPEIERKIKRLLGLKKIIWLPGVRGKDITDGHTNFYARFARPGVVVAGLEMDRDLFDYEVTRTHLELLREATDSQGRPLEIVTLESPRRTRRELRTEISRRHISTFTSSTAL